MLGKETLRVDRVDEIHPHSLSPRGPEDSQVSQRSQEDGRGTVYAVREPFVQDNEAQQGRGAASSSFFTLKPPAHVDLEGPGQKQFAQATDTDKMIS